LQNLADIRDTAALFKLSEVTTCETLRRRQITSLVAWRSGARKEFEVKDAQLRAASGGRPKGDP
jgi:hypothetical protein